MNQYVVLVLDVLIHLSAVFILGFLVSIVVKIFSRGHVDFRLVGGLLIIFVLSVLKIYLEGNIAGFLPGVTPDILFGAMGGILLIVATGMIYWQYSVPIWGALLSGIIVVALQITAALGVPKLSYHFMPEGQRFAEYAGLASAHTQQLMQQAKSFENVNGPSVWQKALAALAFFTSEEESAALSRDFAAGIEVYKERKAIMDNMTDEELAEYRRAMSEFLQEQGLPQNLYSLDNLKNVQPEDLANMASFMKELNGEFDIEESAIVDENIPSSAESLRTIAGNMQGAELSEYQKQIFNDLLSLIDQDDFDAGLEQARAELAALKKDLPVGQLLFAADLDINLDGIGKLSETIEMLPDVGSVLSLEDEELNTEEVYVYEPRDLTNFTSHKMQLGVLLLPPETTDKQMWVDAADTFPCKAWFIGEGAERVAKVVVEDRVMRLGDKWQYRYKGQRLTFHLDDVSEQGIHLSAMN